MRFLLQARKLPIKRIIANTPLAPGAAAKAFGQQCSPQCGCVLRFEASLDTSDGGDRVVSATYHAKTVICTSTTTSPAAANKSSRASGLPPTIERESSRRATLTPQLTLNAGRNQQPMFTNCTCPSLHTLAQQVVAHLPNKSFQKDLRNQVEFTGTRSSLAFSHAVLRKHDLNAETQGHCLDLVEDALTSMIRQFVPRHRKQNTNFTTWLHQYHQPLLEQAEEEEFVERYGRALRRIRKPRHWMGKNEATTSMSLPRSISALNMLDFIKDSDLMGDDGDDDLPLSISLQKNIGKHSTMDWVSYVDELYREEEEQQASA